jgi:hypothetical protein
VLGIDYVEIEKDTMRRQRDLYSYELAQNEGRFVRYGARDGGIEALCALIAHVTRKPEVKQASSEAGDTH